MKALSGLLFLSILAHLQHYYVVTADVTELCRLFKDGTRMRDPDSCDAYIVCENEKGIRQTCASSKLFDPASGDCTEVTSSSSCDSNPCEGVNGKWVADPANCHGFYYCIDSVGYRGFCTEGYHFSESSQLCVHDDVSECMEVSDLCSILSDGTKFRDETNCANYYECSKGKLSSKTCKNTYFDVEQGQCIDKNLVECTAHPTTSKTCGTDKKPSPGYKEDGATCRGFFYCRDLVHVPDLEPTWSQCPVGQFFGSSGCDIPKNVVCKYNRCEGRGTRLVSSSSNDCRDYIICEDGQEKELVTCPGDMFFDEDYQACTKNIISYKCCDGQK